MVAIRPLVSVLMTSYNRESFIAEAIESVLASDYENFELLIVDDCSTDNTVSIAKSYELMDQRIKVFVNDKNITQFANRNKAAAYAKGEFLKYVDSDDTIYPYTLQVMVSAMEKFPQAALGFCVQNAACEFPWPYTLNPEQAYRKHFFGGGFLFVGPSGLIIRKEAFESVNKFEEYGMPSDSHFILKMAARYPVVVLGRDLFWWRLHDGQVFQQNKKNYYNILNNYNYVRDILKNYSPLSPEENNTLFFNYKKRFSIHIFRLLKKAKPQMAFKLLFKLYKQNKV